MKYLITLAVSLVLCTFFFYLERILDLLAEIIPDWGSILVIIVLFVFLFWVLVKALKAQGKL